MSRWREQLDRVERFLERIDRDDVGELDRTEYEDFLWSFFQHCWHLKDWIKNDPNLPSSVDPDDVEEAAKQSDALMLTADLANRTKHLDLTYSRRGGDFGGAKLSVEVVESLGRDSSSDGSAEWDWEIQSDEGPDRWARELARDAVEDWREIIENLGLTS